MTALFRVRIHGVHDASDPSDVTYEQAETPNDAGAQAIRRFVNAGMLRHQDSFTCTVWRTGGPQTIVNVNSLLAYTYVASDD